MRLESGRTATGEFCTEDKNCWTCDDGTAVHTEQESVIILLRKDNVSGYLLMLFMYCSFD